MCLQPQVADDMGHHISRYPDKEVHPLSYGPIYRSMRGPLEQSSGAVWKSRWPPWAFRPNEPYGFCGRKATLNRASALVTICP